MLTCPDCHHSLLAKKVSTRSGGKVEVDQCAFCAGIWFDHFEANQIPLSEVKNLTDGRPKLTADKAIGEGKCPHCLVPLIPLRSESIPQYLNIYACPRCQGNWFSQKEFSQFKQAQQAKIAYLKKWQIPIPSTFSVLLPILILTALALTIPMIVIELRKEAPEVRIRAEEVIIKPTVINLSPTSVIITWATTQAVTSEIKYWSPEVEPLTIPVSRTLTNNHTIELKNLFPNTQYFYQLLLKDQQGREIPSELYSFATK